MNDIEIITNPDPFRYVFGGRVWHARHLTAQRRGNYLSSSLCGHNLISSSETIPGPFPPKQGKPCARCLAFATPIGLPERAFDLLGIICQGGFGTERQTFKITHRTQMAQLYQRDLITGFHDTMPTQLGWRWLSYCRAHPAFDPELRRVFPAKV